MDFKQVFFLTSRGALGAIVLPDNIFICSNDAYWHNSKLLSKFFIASCYAIKAVPTRKKTLKINNNILLSL